MILLVMGLGPVYNTRHEFLLWSRQISTEYFRNIPLSSFLVFHPQEAAINVSPITAVEKV